MGIYDDLHRAELDKKAPTSHVSEAREEAVVPMASRKQVIKSPTLKASNHMSKKHNDKKVITQYDNMASHMTVFQFDEANIESLREPTNSTQTYRMTEEEIEWVKDLAYRLSKEIKRGKVSQADIVRISLKLFSNFLASNKANVIDVLKRMK